MNKFKSVLLYTLFAIFLLMTMPVFADKQQEYFRVAESYVDGTYNGQVGAYIYKENALNKAQETNLFCYDPDGKVVYTPERDIYAVQRSLNEPQFRLGLYRYLSNAKRQADENWGYKVYNIETKKLMYEPKLNNTQKYVATLLRMNQLMIQDIQEGKQWVYSNGSLPKAKTFDQARKQGKYAVNCVDGVQWGLLKSGVVGKTREAIQWYGAMDAIRWLGNDAEKNVKKYFKIIRVGNKTVNKCIKDGTLQTGDIVTYVKMTHTNRYLGNGTSFDSGHAYCKGLGEKAKMTKWIGEVPYGNYKVAYILRLKN